MPDRFDKTPRAIQRPAHLKAPTHWKSDPAPKPQAAGADKQHGEDRDPVRYGDWELNGIAVDF